MTEREALKLMVSPSQVRERYRGGIMQIHITRACDLGCFNCTQLSQLGGAPVVMTPEEFEIACKSLRGYWGVVGIFGGNPALHPKFEELCQILCKHFPYAQRGIWCNHPRGKGSLMRQVFNPAVSNLNVHLVQEAHDEFLRDWPETKNHKTLKGLEGDSRHSPVYVAMIDQEFLPDGRGGTMPNTEENRWRLISNCDINKDWSAMICSVPNAQHSETGRVQGFFCEIAGAMAMKLGKPDLGVPALPGWWQAAMTSEGFANQARFCCHRCGVPMKLTGQLGVNGEHEEISETWANDYKPKRKDRPVELVQITSAGQPQLARMTEYIANAQ